MTLTELEKKACDIRADVVTLIHKAGCGHIGGDMSEVEALVALYYKHLNCSPENEADPDRDRFVLSKGHSVETLYCILADRGYFDKAELMDTYSAYGSRFIGHPSNKIPGIEMNSRAPWATASRSRSAWPRPARWTAGTTTSTPCWATASSPRAASGKASWPAGTSSSTTSPPSWTATACRSPAPPRTSWPRTARRPAGPPLAGMPSPSPATTWPRVDSALTLAKETKGKPTVIILNTTKGCGVSFMENLAVWHHKVMDDAQYETAMAEIAERKASL